MLLSSISASAALVSQPLTLRRHAADRCVVHMGEKPKIVVTGLGTVTAVGSGDEFWSNLLAGVSGVDTIASFDASRFPTTIGAECTDFNAKDHFTNPKNIKVHPRLCAAPLTTAPPHHCCSLLEAPLRPGPGPGPRPHPLTPPHRQATDRYTHLAVAASRMAVEDGGLDLDKVEKQRFGVVVGSAFGGMETFEKQVLQLDKGKKISPFAIPQLLGNTASGMIGIELGAQVKPNLTSQPDTSNINCPISF